MPRSPHPQWPRTVAVSHYGRYFIHYNTYTYMPTVAQHNEQCSNPESKPMTPGIRHFHCGFQAHRQFEYHAPAPTLRPRCCGGGGCTYAPNAASPGRGTAPSLLSYTSKNPISKNSFQSALKSMNLRTRLNQAIVS